MELAAAASYDARLSAAAAARRFVRQTLASWDLPVGTGLLADAELLTSELVTNAVVHAETPVQVTCGADGSEVEVSVLDWEPGLTLPVGPDHAVAAHRATGGGMLLCAALSSSWGITYAPAAKAVWFRLRPRGDGAAAGILPAASSRLAEHGIHGTDAGSGQPPPQLTGRVETDERAAGPPAAREPEPGGFADRDAAQPQHVDDHAPGLQEPAGPTGHECSRCARISFLAEASDLLAGTLDPQQAIALAAQLVVPRLATWCAVLLTDDNGEATPAHVWHADEARHDDLSLVLSRVRPPSASPGDIALQLSLTPLPGERLTPGAAELASDPAWCFPLLARGRSLGTLVIGRPGAGPLSGQAMDLAEDLTGRVALALDNARLYAGQRRASQALQRSLLPRRLPKIPGLEVAAGYQAAGEGNDVGGDFYDVFQVGPGRWRFAIGDVCGKGLEAAAVTGLTRHALRILAREGHDVPAVVERLNSLLVEDESAVPFVTLIHGQMVLAPGQADVSLVCAGHPPPLLLDSEGGTQIAADPQPLLGVIAGATFRSDTCQIGAGDVLLCVTDGVTERRSGERLLDDENGLRRRLSGCSGLSAGAIVARIQREACEFGSSAPADDMAMIVFRGQPDGRVE